MFTEDAKTRIEQLQQDDWHFSDAPTHGQTEAIFTYWQSKCTDGTMPLRSSVDPIEIPNLLPMIVLVDAEEGPPVRFRLRLLGTSVVDIVGEERTGRYLDEFGENLTGDVRQEIVGRWQKTCLAVYTTQRPMFVQGIRRNPERTYQTVHVAALPLTTDGITVSHLLGAIVTEAATSS